MTHPIPPSSRRHTQCQLVDNQLTPAPPRRPPLPQTLPVKPNTINTGSLAGNEDDRRRDQLSPARVDEPDKVREVTESSVMTGESRMPHHSLF